MGSVISAAFGPMAIPGAGDVTFQYIHPPKATPSRVGLIAAHISAGTQTGSCSISYGNDATNALEIGHGVFAADAPSFTLHPHIVIQPGQVILIRLYNVTAGDTVRAFVEGH